MFKNFYTTHSVFQISYLLFFTALPFVFSESFIDPVVMPRQAFLTLFLLITWSILFFKKHLKNPALQISHLSLAILAASGLLVLLSFISTGYSHIFSESIYVSSKYGINFLFLITTYFLLRARLIFTHDLVNGVILFCGISLCYGVYDIIQLWNNNLNIFTHAFTITATYANKNLFASVVTLCLWAILIGNLHFLLRLTFMVVLTALLLFIQSKIAILVMVGILLALGLKNIRLFKKFRGLTVAGALLVLAAMVLVFLNFQRFINLASLHTLDTRYALWTNSFHMFLEKPFGVGAGNWQVFFAKSGLSHFDVPEIRSGSALGRQPHNDFIWMLCELGIQGFIVYLSVFILVIVQLIRLVRKNQTPLSFLLLITVLGYCLTAFFDFPLERMEHQVLLSVIIALSMHNYDTVCDTLKEFKPFTYGLVYLLLITVSGVVCYYRLKGEYLTQEIISLDKKKYAEWVVKNCDKAKSVFFEIDPIGVPIDWYAGMSLLRTDKITEAQVRLEKARGYMPYNIRILNRLGAIYAQQGKRAKAVECYRTALSISPTATLAPLK